MLDFIIYIVCARELHEYMKLDIVGKLFYCESDGSYSKVGCLGTVCFCQDKFGKQVGEQEVPLWEKETLICWYVFSLTLIFILTKDILIAINVLCRNVMAVVYLKSQKVIELCGTY